MSRRTIVAPALASLSIGAFLWMAATASAAPLVVDGSLADWGFTVADDNGSTFIPSNDYTLAGMITEDTGDNKGDGFFLGPNHGGQNYDAEALSVGVQDGAVYVAIVSGQRPDNGLTHYGPGDLQIVTAGGNKYGVEFGGGAGGGDGSALTEGGAGSTYDLDSGGFTVGLLPTNVAQTVGSVWLNPSWILDPLVPFEQAQLQIGGGGTLVGQADYYFTRDTVTTQHSIMELSIPLSIFGGDPIAQVIWRPSCGNDELILGALNVVPEPASFVMGGVALLGLAGVACRRRRRS